MLKIKHAPSVPPPARFAPSLFSSAAYYYCYYEYYDYDYDYDYDYYDCYGYDYLL